MRFVKELRLALVSPWVLAAACALLALIIGVFAVNNYRREKRLMTDVLLERGATLIRFVASGARASFFDRMREGRAPAGQWPEYVQEILERGAEQPGVHFLALVDGSGNILASSSTDKTGSRVDQETLAFLATVEQGIHGLGTFRYRFSGRDQTTAFQVASLFVPIGKRQFERQVSMLNDLHRGVEGLAGRMMRHQRMPPEWTDELEQVSKHKYSILVELDLAELQKAVSRQLLQIVILSIVLLLVGIGGWLSLLTLARLKGSQSRLMRIKAFRDTLISSLPVGLIVTDSEGRIMICNQLAEQIASVTENEVVGFFPEDVLAPELALALAGQKMAPDGSMRQEIILKDKKGLARTLQLNSLLVVDNEGASSGVMLLIQDLTQVKSLEEELRRSERMAVLGKMAAGVAHELRNPLSSIKGLALLLRSRFQDPAPSVAPMPVVVPLSLERSAQGLGMNNDKETADILVQEVERLNRSIGELLDYARPQKLIKEDVHPQEAVQKAIALIRMDAESAGVRVEVNADEKLPLIQVDQDKLNQVFLNLFLNAIQAMEYGGTLDIRVKEAGKKVLFMIKDTGCGVSNEDLPRIFDPYFTTKPEGTGLGLAMSLKIVEEHGGAITVESEPDRGTTVVVSFPRKEEF
jgi:two-component system sensor histidine kinase HydH